MSPRYFGFLLVVIFALMINTARLWTRSYTQEHYIELLIQNVEAQGEVRALMIKRMDQLSVEIAIANGNLNDQQKALDILGRTQGIVKQK